MKKRLLLLSMIGALTLVGCDVNQMKDENGNQIIVKLGDGTAYTADQLFDDYKLTSAGASEYYNAVYDVLVRAVQPKTSAIERDVSTAMDDFIEDCKKSASDNGTTYRAERSKALEAKGVESLDELQELYYLQYQKTEFENNFYDSNLNNKLLEEYIQYYAPYHVRHILVKNSADSSLYKGTISADDAINLSDTVTRLASGKESFGVIAQSTASNGDEGSAKKYGDLGIMDITTGYVSEFKYSVYQYEALFNPETKDKITEYDNKQKDRKINDTSVPGSALLPITEDQKTELKESINRIPFNVFTKLKDVAKIETGEDGLQKYDGKAEYFPRNYIYNTYLNNHALGVVVKGSLTSTSDRWQTKEGLSASTNESDKVLCDEEGNPILVSKAGTGSGDSGYQGLHFIIIQKSAFKDSLDTLKSYYDIDTPYSSEITGTFASFISADSSTYNERVKDVENNVKGFDSYMNYRLYEDALKKALDKGAKVNESIASIIDNYIKANRETTAYNAVETYEKSWKSYMDLLQVQKNVTELKVQKDVVEEAFGNGLVTIA